MAPLTIAESDLFSGLGDWRFDLIVFNQPYFPADEREYVGGTLDGGYAIIKRFLLQAPRHLNRGGMVVMSFQDTAGAVHDPKSVAAELGVRVRVLYHESQEGINRFIYEMTFASEDAEPERPRMSEGESAGFRRAIEVSELAH